MDDVKQNTVDMKSTDEDVLKKKYETPRLAVYGDVRSLTQGASVKTGEAMQSGL